VNGIVDNKQKESCKLIVSEKIKDAVLNLNIVYVRFCIFVTQARNKIGNLHNESPIGAYREQAFIKFSSLN
jgi:hypothetical protein